MCLRLGPSASGVLVSPWRQGASAVTEVNSDGGRLSLLGFRLISLKVLNSIVLLGKSCQYVKRAKMEEKLFNPPPTGTPSKPPSKSQSKCKPSPGRCPSRHTSASCSEGCSSEPAPDTLSLPLPQQPVAAPSGCDFTLLCCCGQCPCVGRTRIRLRQCCQVHSLFVRR